MAYIYKVKLSIQVYLTYRFEVVANIVTRIILIIANLFLWNSVYSEKTILSGVGKEQMITYSVLSVCLSIMYQCGVQNSLNNDIREGNIAILLMRPYHLLGAYLAEDIGSIIVKTISISFPVLILSFLFLPMKLLTSIHLFAIIFISYILGFLILWLLSALVGLFAFVTMELGNMGVVKDAIVSILSGSMVPLWFFPDKVENVLMLTPFPYTYQLPLGLYIGQIEIQEGLRQIGIQCLWLVMIGIFVKIAWKKVQIKVLIQGG